MFSCPFPTDPKYLKTGVSFIVFVLFCFFVCLFVFLILNFVFFTRESTTTTAVYGKHIFQNNFSLAIMLEMFCCLNKTYLQKENVVKN